MKKQLILLCVLLFSFLFSSIVMNAESINDKIEPIVYECSKGEVCNFSVDKKAICIK